MKFPFYKQLDAMDCGPTCLRMIAAYYGRKLSLDYIRNKTGLSRRGVTMLALADTAEALGFRSAGVRISFDQLLNEVPLPAILHWRQRHYVVLTPQSTRKKLVVADPAKGVIHFSKEQFLANWISDGDRQNGKGVALLLEETPLLQEAGEGTPHKIVTRYLMQHLRAHQRYFIQILIGLMIGSVLQLALPYLTQSIVDKGINSRNLRFIQVILIAQLMLFFSQTVIELIRNRILLHISTRINVSLLSTFWSKLLRLPIRFFDSRHPGDILQRITDHHRIESFLTGTALNTAFSLLTLLIFSIVLLNYSLIIFLFFAGGSLLYLGWIRLFLYYRRQLEYQRFSIASRENNATMQLVYGMQEIKLNNAENAFRWSWEGLQAGLFRLNFKTLSLSQYQQIGAFFINNGKNLIITYIVARLVVQGEMTLGMMLAVQYIIGQLNGPVEQLVGFAQQAQDARISMERLNDVHQLEDEVPAGKVLQDSLPEQPDIVLKNLSFTYPTAGQDPVLRNINCTIPHGKVTAVVGMSGSGKTTLLKLLLRFYDNYEGEMSAGSLNMRNISPQYWRSICGAVMQDSFIFNGDIRKNIIIDEERADDEKLMRACRTANILSFITALPSGFQTRLGAEGVGLSGGQRQRLAIARAVYKDPQFLFFDEATNALDAQNERMILENLRQIFDGKTVVVIAHRLSTVRHADHIIVLDEGRILEQGTHAELTNQKGKYYELVKNQLELDT